MSLGMVDTGHFKIPQWVYQWNKSHKRTLKVINPFNSPAQAPHATAENTAAPQNKSKKRETDTGWLYKSRPLKYIYINESIPFLWTMRHDEKIQLFNSLFLIKSSNYKFMYSTGNSEASGYRLVLERGWIYRWIAILGKWLFKECSF